MIPFLHFYFLTKTWKELLEIKNKKKKYVEKGTLIHDPNNENA